MYEYLSTACPRTCQSHWPIHVFASHRLSSLFMVDICICLFSTCVYTWFIKVSVTFLVLIPYYLPSSSLHLLSYLWGASVCLCSCPFLRLYLSLLCVCQCLWTCLIILVRTLLLSSVWPFLCLYPVPVLSCLCICLIPRCLTVQVVLTVL